MEEGYIEVTNHGLRLISPITTKHVAGMGLGAAVFSPLGILFGLLGWVLPGPSYLWIIGAFIGVVPGLVLGLISLPRRQISAITWLYRKVRFRLKCQSFYFDREYRQRKNFERITQWMQQLERGSDG